jgi:hypothetical protein
MDRDGDTAPVVATTVRGYDFHTMFLIGTEFPHPVTGEPCHTTTYGRGHNVLEDTEVAPHVEKYMGQPTHILMHPKSCPMSEEKVPSWGGNPDDEITVVSHLCEWAFEGPLDRDLDRVMTTEDRPRIQGTYRILYEGEHVTGFEPLKLATDDNDTNEAETSQG